MEDSARSCRLLLSNSLLSILFWDFWIGELLVLCLQTEQKNYATPPSPHTISGSNHFTRSQMEWNVDTAGGERKSCISSDHCEFVRWHWKNYPYPSGLPWKCCFTKKHLGCLARVHQPWIHMSDKRTKPLLFSEKTERVNEKSYLYFWLSQSMGS